MKIPLNLELVNKSQKAIYNTGLSLSIDSNSPRECIQLMVSEVAKKLINSYEHYIPRRTNYPHTEHLRSIFIHVDSTLNSIFKYLNEPIFEYLIEQLKIVVTTSNNTNIPYCLKNKIQLIEKLIEFRKVENFSINDSQLSNIFKMLNALSNSKFNISEIAIKLSADDEIYFIRENINGKYYLIAGEDLNDISFGYVGNNLGEHKHLHISNSNVTNDINSLIINFIDL